MGHCRQRWKRRCLVSNCCAVVLRLVRIIVRQHARSVKEFISKIEGGIQELDETIYWLELLVEGEIVSESKLTGLMKETDELLSILTASAKTAKAGRS